MKYLIFVPFLLIMPFQALAAFSDVPTTSQHYQAISALENKNIIQGYGDGTFRPQNTINRAELLKIVMGINYPNVRGANCFPDVGTEWFASYVCMTKDLGIISGYPDGKFKPANNIIMIETLKIALNGLNYPLSNTTGTEWYSIYLNTARENNLLGSVSASLGQTITRGEAAQMIYNIQKSKNPGYFPVVSKAPNTSTPSTPTPTPTTPSSSTPSAPSTPNNSIPTILANNYSWDSSWNPLTSDFPIQGLLDSKYFDGHPVNGSASPILPPGKWDYNDNNNDLANFRNFDTNIGHFDPLKDNQNHQYGWKLVTNSATPDFSGPAEYFHGSSGSDIINLGKNGQIHSIKGNLGDGPDVLVFDKSYSLDYGTGTTGDKNDNDLVIAGCQDKTDSSFSVQQTTIHTGPGNDLIFAKNMTASAIDAGNGNGGNTSVLDPSDGNDTVIFHGNMHDFRFFGGNGNDVAFWYPDEVNQKDQYLGPNFFGGGGAGDAIWGDKGTDTLVLAIPTDTEITSVTPTKPGQLLVRTDLNYPKDPQWDEPTVNDPNAKYCINCGIGPNGEKTITMEYNSKDGRVHTGYFTVTAFERLQIGLGSNAKTYDLDGVKGTAIPNNNLPKLTPPEEPNGFCN